LNFCFFWFKPKERKKRQGEDFNLNTTKPTAFFYIVNPALEVGSDNENFSRLKYNQPIRNFNQWDTSNASNTSDFPFLGQKLWLILEKGFIES
jgi:hypothetical protein